ncbi:MAG TPA: carboxyvinyl-carboxyphosphonate phosphorylmutase, partial [Rhodospirillaceae bacterium]|nr:carboxyvinyl-carboxyphosphonate phosphorylmutase [Rhodospirillaceae bacterium]
MSKNPGAEVRKHLATGKIAMSVSAHDALTAKLVEKAGFEMISISGNAVAASYLGMPDMGFITLPEIVDVSRRIAAAVDIPVMVDADTGYGNAVQVTRTVEEFERAGVAGIIIEDQIDYKKCRMIEGGGHPVVAAEDHAAKVEAACAARNDSDFLIIARTDAAADHGLEEAIRRAHLYIEAGADMLDVEVFGTPEEVAEIKAARLSVPLKANMDEGKGLWKMGLDDLADAGYGIASYPGVVRYTVVKAVADALAELKRAGNAQNLIPTMSS